MSDALVKIIEVDPTTQGWKRVGFMSQRTWQTPDGKFYQFPDGVNETLTLLLESSRND